MTERDEKVLQHIGRYRLSIRAVIEQLFFDGKSCDHVIQRFLESEPKRIQQFAGLPNGLSYYQLTLPEARRRGLPHDRAKEHSAGKLRESLAILWFCCMGEKRFIRADRKQLKLFGRGEGMGMPHCYEKTPDGRTVVYRVHVPGPNTDNERLIRKIHHDSEAALASPTLAQYVLAKLYGFAIIVDSDSREQRLKDLLARREPPVSIHLACVPGVDHLAEAIRDLRREN